MAGIKLQRADIPTQSPVRIEMTFSVVAKERYIHLRWQRIGHANNSSVGRHYNDQRTWRILLDLSDLGAYPVLISCFDFRRFHETTARSLHQVYSRHESPSENGREKTSWALFLRVFRYRLNDHVSVKASPRPHWHRVDDISLCLPCPRYMWSDVKGSALL